jgi:acetyl esterase/lipase
MDFDITTLIRALLPKMPLVIRVAFMHMLQASPPSRYVDLRTEITVALLRSFTEKAYSMTATQKFLNAEAAIKGRIWVSNYTAPVPAGNDVQDLISKAIRGLEDTSAPPLDLSKLPDVVPVEAEWTGYRAGGTESSTLPAISEAAKYGEMMKECKTQTTILYFHGGAYCFLDPASHRPTTKKLAKLTGGRCYSVRYRLSPQHMFPAALIDALVSYLTLLYPPDDAYHDPVEPEHIVFAGDR